MTDDKAHLIELLGKIIIRFDLGVYLPNLADFPGSMELIEDIRHELEMKYGIKP